MAVLEDCFEEGESSREMKSYGSLGSKTVNSLFSSIESMIDLVRLRYPQNNKIQCTRLGSKADLPEH